MLITEGSATYNQNQRRDNKNVDFQYTYQWNDINEEQLKHFFNIHQGNWKSISKSLNGPSPLECMRRWQRLNPNKTLSRQLWSQEEDEQLIELVKKYGNKWSKICKVMNWRSGKQVRERYLNQLQVHINNENWTDQEDKLIFKLYKKFGTKWSYISSQLNGRPENMVKNRFYATLKRKFQKELDDENQSKDSQDSINITKYKKKKMQRPQISHSIQIKKCQLQNVNSQIFKRITRSNINKNKQSDQIKEEYNQEQQKNIIQYQQCKQEQEIKSISYQSGQDEIISNIPYNPIMLYTTNLQNIQVSQQYQQNYLQQQIDQQYLKYDNIIDQNQLYFYHNNNYQYHQFIQPIINNNYRQHQQLQQFTNQIFQ